MNISHHQRTFALFYLFSFQKNITITLRAGAPLLELVSGTKTSQRGNPVTLSVTCRPTKNAHNLRARKPQFSEAARLPLENFLSQVHQTSPVSTSNVNANNQDVCRQQDRRQQPLEAEPL